MSTIAGGAGTGLPNYNWDNVLTGSYNSGSQQATNNQTQTGNNAQTSMNQYSPEQQAAQSNALGAYQGLLSGQSMPQNFQVPQSTIDAYVANYNKYIAPNRAYQYGEGSPTISTGLQEGLAQLLGSAAPGMMSQYMGAINGAGAMAFNPQGQVQSGNQQQSMNGTQDLTHSGYQVNADLGGIMNRLVDFFK